ncbi:MAG: multicopper oxidase domain-containing protein [Nitrosopumilus sp.]|nr:multicopper oxidase domain-containing protein [Nitrosopumilus sp.]
MKLKNQNIKISFAVLSVITVSFFLIPFGSFDNSSDQGIFSTLFALADNPKTHFIEMNASALPNGQLAYQMISHEVDYKNGKIRDITVSRYGNNPTPSIPGPAIIINQGDEVFLKLINNLGEDCVSVHVHGVHYSIEDDGTLAVTNKVEDSCATPEKSKTYHWVAAKGTVGTWPYHDHTFGGETGAEDKGLFGIVIVNDSQTEAFIDGNLNNIPVNHLDKEYVLYMVRTSFWGLEIDHKNGGLQTPLWENPTLSAKLNDEVRFHVVGLGTEFHTFHMHAHRWVDQGTTDVIDTKNIGPLARHVFVVKAGEGVGPGDWMYHCHVFRHMELGMTGMFKVSTDGGPSIPGYSPLV